MKSLAQGYSGRSTLARDFLPRGVCAEHLLTLEQLLVIKQLAWHHQEIPGLGQADAHNLGVLSAGGWHQYEGHWRRVCRQWSSSGSSVHTAGST